MGANNNGKNFIVGTIIGSVVGATVALLFAPKSGRELREDINKGAAQAKDMAYEWKEVAQEKGAELKDRAYEKGNELTQKAMDSTSDIRKTVAQKTQDLTKAAQTKLEGIKNKQNDAIDTAEAVAEKVEETAKKVEK